MCPVREELLYLFPNRKRRRSRVKIYKIHDTAKEIVTADRRCQNTLRYKGGYNNRNCLIYKLQTLTNIHIYTRILIFKIKNIYFTSISYFVFIIYVSIIVYNILLIMNILYITFRSSNTLTLSVIFSNGRYCEFYQ